MLLSMDDALHELALINQKILEGVKNLSTTFSDQIAVGTTPKEEIYREDKVVLYRYKPTAENLFPVPLLIVYSLVNRPALADLQEDRSLVRNLLNLGMEVYLIDWGYPTRIDRWLTLDDYINGYLNTCVDVIRERHGLDNINLLGICQGGCFSLCYAALEPEKVKNLVLMVTPVDFHAGSAILNLWSGYSTKSDLSVDLTVDAFGNIPSNVLNFGFLMRQPFEMFFGKYLSLMDILDDTHRLHNFLRVEKWSFDSPDQAGETFRQFLKDFYQENKLVKGQVEIGGQTVDLGAISAPVLNLHAEFDDLVPAESVRALESYIGTTDYTVMSFPVGHIGMYVSGKVQATLPPAIVDWLRERP